MKMHQLYVKNNKELTFELLLLLQEQFNLRMRKTSGQLQQTHLIKQVRHNIARIKMLLAKKRKI